MIESLTYWCPACLKELREDEAYATIRRPCNHPGAITIGPLALFGAWEWEYPDPFTGWVDADSYNQWPIDFEELVDADTQRLSYFVMVPKAIAILDASSPEEWLIVRRWELNWDTGHFSLEGRQTLLGDGEYSEGKADFMATWGDGQVKQHDLELIGLTQQESKPTLLNLRSRIYLPGRSRQWHGDDRALGGYLDTNFEFQADELSLANAWSELELC